MLVFTIKKIVINQSKGTLTGLSCTMFNQDSKVVLFAYYKTNIQGMH